ncbi:hypothetical protein [Streptomyces sp. NPDC002994]|uniref:hypothetical protein n=1 Tax=Streptomyces sp. NPDC002994 TaxID=3154441 RepID=UPI0033A59CE4
MSSHVTSRAPERAAKRSVSLANSLVKEVEGRIGKRAFSSVVSEALEHWLAMDKLREVVAADRREFGQVSDEARRQAEQEW